MYNISKNADDIFEDVEKLEKEALDLLEKDYAGYQEKCAKR